MSEETRTPSALPENDEAQPKLRLVEDVPQPAGVENEVPIVTWEDDENIGTLGLRAAVTLVSGGLLAYCQWNAPIQPGLEWGRWVWTSVLFNLLIPAGIIWFFFGQTFYYVEWLKKQQHNAWNYGWGRTLRQIEGQDRWIYKFDFSDWKRYLAMGAALWVGILPFLLYFSAQPAARAGYATYLPVPQSAGDWAFLLSTLVLYMFCWEWFFRGFLLFGLAQGFTWIPAVLIQAVIFGLTHMGKPQIEMYGAFAGGIILGTLCWREKSFLPAFFAHALIHVTWAILILRPPLF